MHCFASLYKVPVASCPVPVGSGKVLSCRSSGCSIPLQAGCTLDDPESIGAWDGLCQSKRQSPPLGEAGLRNQGSVQKELRFHHFEMSEGSATGRCFRPKLTGSAMFVPGHHTDTWREWNNWCNCIRHCQRTEPGFSCRGLGDLFPVYGRKYQRPLLRIEFGGSGGRSGVARKK